MLTTKKLELLFLCMIKPHVRIVSLLDKVYVCDRDRELYYKKLESSQSPYTFAKAMLFARWQYHLRFCSGFS